MNHLLLIGTTKGLVVAKITKSNCEFISVHFDGMPVSMVYVDERTNTWWVALSHKHWGEKLHYSNDEGKNWIVCSIPSYEGYAYRQDKPASLKKIWVMKHAGIDRPGCLWLGSEPGGLFFSDDNGKTFHLNESLWNHPSRLKDTQWFGAGKDYPFIHSVLVDPRNSNHIYIGVSCAGVFETTDGGKSWQARNNGLVAAYLPNPKQEIGHDPHLILMHKKDPDVLWQQNHCGIFRSTNEGKSWDDVSGKNARLPDGQGFPKYGFSIAMDENDPDTAWVIPAESDEKRVPVNYKLTVCKTQNGGKDWEILNRGLPSLSFELILRHSFIKRNNLLAFGTNNGNLYLSFDYGNSWKREFSTLAGINALAIR